MARFVRVGRVRPGGLMQLFDRAVQNGLRTVLIIKFESERNPQTLPHTCKKESLIISLTLKLKKLF